MIKSSEIRKQAQGQGNYHQNEFYGLPGHGSRASRYPSTELCCTVNAQAKISARDQALKHSRLFLKHIGRTKAPYHQRGYPTGSQLNRSPRSHRSHRGHRSRSAQDQSTGLGLHCLSYESIHSVLFSLIISLTKSNPSVSVCAMWLDVCGSVERVHMAQSGAEWSRVE